MDFERIISGSIDYLWNQPNFSQVCAWEAFVSTGLITDENAGWSKELFDLLTAFYKAVKKTKLRLLEPEEVLITGMPWFCEMTLIKPATIRIYTKEPSLFDDDVDVDYCQKLTINSSGRVWLSRTTKTTDLHEQFSIDIESTKKLFAIAAIDIAKPEYVDIPGWFTENGHYELSLEEQTQTEPIITQKEEILGSTDGSPLTAVIREASGKPYIYACYGHGDIPEEWKSYYNKKLAQKENESHKDSETESTQIIETEKDKSLFDRYEELLLRKNDLKKECFQLEQEYIRVFGEDIMAVFRKQIECAKKVKTIEFCQRYLNRGAEPDTAELQAFVKQETQELLDHLQAMTEEYEQSKTATKITEAEAVQIKSLYRRIVKRLHPDTHPEISGSEKLQDLWNQVIIAYECNSLDDLKELEVLVSSALSELGNKAYNTDIPDLQDRIAKVEAEIKEIMDKDPYQYKFLLNDPVAIQTKKKALAEEKQNYIDYSAALDEKLESILPEGTIIFWEE